MSWEVLCHRPTFRTQAKNPAPTGANATRSARRWSWPTHRARWRGLRTTRLQRWSSDVVRTGLYVVGLISGVGEIAGGASALIYLAEGYKVNTALNAAVMILRAGMVATAAAATTEAQERSLA